MNKKDISKALTQGSAKQRATIIAENIAQYSKTGKGFLKYSDDKALYESFKTSAEIRIYNKYIKVGREVTQSLSYLKQLQLLYEVNIAYLTGYCLLWDEYDREGSRYTELLYNIKDRETRKTISKLIKEARLQPLLGNIEKVKEGQGVYITGTIKIQVKDLLTRKGKKRYGLYEIIKEYSKRATKQLREAKALALAILEYMDEEEFNVKTYKEIVKEVMDALSRDQAVLPYYSIAHQRTLEYKTEESWKLHEEIFSEFWVFPDPDTEPDRERIDWYKNEYIKI
jgi:hypothetical protein